MIPPRPHFLTFSRPVSWPDPIFLTDMDELFEERCAGCWAIRLCMKCINDVNKNGEVDRESFETFCSARKQAILSEIKDYIKIRESNYHALDYLEEVTLI